jgi:putative tricarboxylic transport membrane protein
MFLLVSVLFARPLALVTLVRAELLAPIFLILCFAGVYAQDQQFSDILLAIFFGLVGCTAKALDFPPVPLVLGLVVGRLLETSVVQSLAISSGDWTIFFTRPVSGSLLAVAAAIIAFTTYKGIRAKPIPSE